MTLPYHLIDTKTLDLVDIGTILGHTDVVKYAILSHVWLKKGEVTYQTYPKPGSMERAKMHDPTQATFMPEEAGLAKIAWAAWTARNGAEDEQAPYLWSDTCCINKESEAELSESLRLMFKWYNRAHICYTFLADVTERATNPSDQGANLRRLENSEWFNRGWTLQELLASKDIRFYNQEWLPLGTKAGLIDRISSAARIEREYLANDSNFKDACIAVRMSWMAHRSTSKTEDMAYAMLGVFDVNMDIRYGEEEDAFRRLQEEIVSNYPEDESIFAWRRIKNDHEPQSFGLLAPWPTCFLNCGALVIEPPPKKEIPRAPVKVENRGVSFGLPAKWMDHNEGFTLNDRAAGKMTDYDLGLMVWDRKNLDAGNVTIKLHRSAPSAPWRRMVTDTLPLGDTIKPAFETKALYKKYNFTKYRYAHVPHQVAGKSENDLKKGEVAKKIQRREVDLPLWPQRQSSPGPEKSKRRWFGRR